MAISAPPRRRSQAVPSRHRTLAGALVLALIAVLVLATALVVLLVRGGSRSSGVQGSGVAATQSRVLPGFSRLDLAGSASVTVVTGGRQSVVVRADNNLIRYVTTRVAAGTLFIGTTGSYTTRTPMSVEVSAPSLAAVTLSGSGEISVSGIKAPRLTVTLPGSGALYASGTADRLDVTLGGSGLAQLSNLIARDARGRRRLRPHPHERHGEPERDGLGYWCDHLRRQSTARDHQRYRHRSGDARGFLAAWQPLVTYGSSSHLAGLNVGRLGALPGDRQLVAFAEPFDVPGDDALDPLQAFLVRGFGAQRQRARGGPHGALAPAEADHPAGFGAFDLLDLGRRLPVTTVIAGLVTQAMDLQGVVAELGEVAAWVFGRDLGFGGEHGSPFGGDGCAVTTG